MCVCVCVFLRITVFYFFNYIITMLYCHFLPSSVAQLDVRPTDYQEVAGLISAGSSNVFEPCYYPSLNIILATFFLSPGMLFPVHLRTDI